MDSDVFTVLFFNCFRNDVSFQSLDSVMVAHITTKSKEEVSERLTRKWETDCKEQKEISVEIFENKKEDWIEEKVTIGFRNDSANKSKE